MSERVCPHASEFACWYRIEGRCCHGAVEDMAGCHGQWPTRNVRPASAGGRIPLPAFDAPSLMAGRSG
jgi:hypothetical protein